MKLQSVSKILTESFSKDSRPTAYMLQGAPGVGKTAIISQIAEKLGMELLNIALPTCESIDLRGLPYNDNGITKWASPLPKSGSGILLLDEVSSAPSDVQVAAHHIVWAEKGSDMFLPPEWHLVLTGNRMEDNTHYTGLSAPLRNRMTLIDVTVNAHEWKEWALTQKISPSIVGFIHWRPELLTCADVPEEGAFVSPRSWERLNSLLNFQCSADEEFELIKGTVGIGAAKEFSTYLSVYRHLPSIDIIMRDPFNAEIPKSPALLYALVVQLASWTNQEQKSAMPYIQRMPTEYTLLWIKKVSGNYTLTNDSLIETWIENHKQLF